MNFPFEKKLADRAKGSLIGTIIFWFVLLTWEGLVHEFYTKLNPQVIEALSPFRLLIATAARSTIQNPSWILIGLLAPFPILFGLSFLLPKMPPPIEIISHQSGDLVDHKQIIAGITRKSKSLVQVFVRPQGEHKWYRQGSGSLNQRIWRVNCHFGSFQCPAGQSFDVVAVSGAKPTEEHLMELPTEGVKSAPVTLRRSPIIGLEYEPGLYSGRTRKILKPEDWLSYTNKDGRVTNLDGALQFRGAFENGFRYPPQDSELIPARMLVVRFKPDGEINFYAHFRDAILYFTSRHAGEKPNQYGDEYRISLPPSLLTKNWQTVFLYLPCLEHRIGKHLDTLKRISVRGNLVLSHFWCVERLRDLPMQHLYNAEDLTLNI